MNKILIRAISLLHKGERIVIEANLMGKFKVPVTSVENGQLRTRMRNLSARQVVEHDVVKNCDPTLYLKPDNRVRVFQGGDPGYLPAAVDGIITKHDAANKISLPKSKKKILDNPITIDRDKYHQAGLDMYGWWPDDREYGDAD